MAFLTSCFNRLPDSSSFSRFRRSKEGTLQKHPTSPTAGPKYSPPSPNPSTLSTPIFARSGSIFSSRASAAYSSDDEQDESQPLMSSHSGSPGLRPPNDTLAHAPSFLSVSSAPRPGDMTVVKSASAEGGLRGLPDRLFDSNVTPNNSLLGDMSFVDTVPGPSKVSLDPSTAFSGNLLDFSPDAFQLDKYVVNKGETLGAATAAVKELPSPPFLSKPESSQATTIYYTMTSRNPGSPVGGLAASSERTSPRKRGDDHETYLESLKLLSFGHSEGAKEEPLTALEFSFNLVPDSMDDEWEEVNLLSYGWV